LTARAPQFGLGPIASCAALAAILTISALAVPLPGRAQTAAKKPRVGILGITPSIPANHEMFKQALGQLGYNEGQQVVLVDQHAGGVPARLSPVATELVRAGIDVILARGQDAVAAAARATKTIPIVAVDMQSDPIALGYAKSLARPGGNVTGVFLDLPELSAKQLQILRQLVPGLSRIALVGHPTGNLEHLRATERAAQTLGIQVQIFEGRTPAELDTALEGARRGGVGAVLVFSSPAVFYNNAHVTALAREKRLPTVSLFTEFAEAGGLLTYGPSVRDSFRRAGIYVAKILNGAKPADLPIERPDKFELAINLKTAKALGLTIPPSLLLQADKVIE